MKQMGYWDKEWFSQKRGEKRYLIFLIHPENVVCLFSPCNCLTILSESNIVKESHTQLDFPHSQRYEGRHSN